MTARWLASRTEPLATRTCLSCPKRIVHLWSASRMEPSCRLRWPVPRRSCRNGRQRSLQQWANLAKVYAINSTVWSTTPTKTRNLPMVWQISLCWSTNQSINSSTHKPPHIQLKHMLMLCTCEWEQNNDLRLFIFISVCVCVVFTLASRQFFFRWASSEVWFLIDGCDQVLLLCNYYAFWLCTEYDTEF